MQTLETCKTPLVSTFKLFHGTPQLIVVAGAEYRLDDVCWDPVVVELARPFEHLFNPILKIEITSAMISLSGGRADASFLHISVAVWPVFSSWATARQSPTASEGRRSVRSSEWHSCWTWKWDKPVWIFPPLLWRQLGCSRLRVKTAESEVPHPKVNKAQKIQKISSEFF